VRQNQRLRTPSGKREKEQSAELSIKPLFPERRPSKNQNKNDHERRIKEKKIQKADAKKD